MGSISPDPNPEPVVFPPAQQHPSLPPTTLHDDHPTIQEITTPVLIVGGGPVGMLLSYTLSHHHNLSCTLVESSTTTTIYPKMEFTNGRTMEIYRSLGLHEQIRALGVPEQFSLNEIITTGLTDTGKVVSRWQRPSPEECRREAERVNDGTFAREPYLRCSQIPVEAWLKDLVLSPSGGDIRSLFGWRFISLKEEEDVVVSEIVNVNNENKRMRVRSKYVVGCDGAGSLVRKVLGIQTEKKNLNMTFIFIHIASSDPRLKSQGQFWHLMTLSGAVCVNQDEQDMYTFHLVVPDDTEINGFDTEKAIREAVGGFAGECEVAIDEVKVIGMWRSRVGIADSFRSPGGRVFWLETQVSIHLRYTVVDVAMISTTDDLPAHQLSPVGGHGLNSGIHDLWGLSWKIAALLQGWGGDRLLDTYDCERRPVAYHNMAMVEKGTHDVLLPLFTSVEQYGKGALTADTEEGKAVRRELAKTMDKGYWLHHQDGTTLGYRYSKSPIVIHDQGIEPENEVYTYTPTTWPGGRPPHVFLQDGQTSVLDLLGKGFNVVDLTLNGTLGNQFVHIATELGVPLKLIHLPQEKHVRNIWEREVVMLRPDQHVCWRCLEGIESISDREVREVLRVVTGNSQ